MARAYISYIWAFLSRASTQIISFLFVAVTSRFLSPDDFGMIGVLAVFISISNILIDSGLSASLILDKSAKDIDWHTLFSFNFVVSLVLYLLLFLMASKIESYFEIQNLAFVCRIISLTIVIQALYIVPKTLLVKNLRFDVLFWVQLVASALSAIVSLYFVMCWNMRVEALLFYYILLAMLPCVGFWYAAKYRPKFRFSKSSFKKMFAFGSFNTLSSAIDTLYENILSIFIGKFYNVSQAGYYTNAKRIEEVPSKSFTELVASVTFPHMSKMNEDRDQFVAYADKLQCVLYPLIFPVMVLCAIFSSQIITVVYGAIWQPASEYLSVLSFAGIAIVIENTTRSYIKSLGRADSMFTIALIKRSIGVFILVAAVCININWLLYAYVLASFIGAFLNIYMLSRIIEYPIKHQLKLLLRICCPLALYAASVFVVNNISDSYYVIGVSVLILSILYFLLLPIFGLNDSHRILLDWYKRVSC